MFSLLSGFVWLEVTKRQKFGVQDAFQNEIKFQGELWFEMQLLFLPCKAVLGEVPSISSSIAFMLANAHILKCKITVIEKEKGFF